MTCYAPNNEPCSWVCDLGECQYKPYPGPQAAFYGEQRMKPYDIVRGLESAICDYTGAPFCVVVNSCTIALLLAVKWHLRNYDDGYPQVSIPKRTYVSVPMSIIHAGGRVVFRDEDWTGLYQLQPLPVWDSARWFSSGMYGANHVMEFPAKEGSGFDKVKFLTPLSGSMLCVSFHTTKVLGDTQGGAILHDCPEADAWLRRMRFDGRTEGVAPKDDDFREIGYHCYMSPDVAARLLHRLSVLPAYNPPLPNDDYPDLSQLEIFK